MKEITTIITLEVTTINKIKDGQILDIKERELENDLKKNLEADDVKVTNVQNFERDIPETKKPKIVFSSQEQMEAFFNDLSLINCPSNVGLEVSDNCDHNMDNSQICIDCWKNAFNLEVVEDD